VALTGGRGFAGAWRRHCAPLALGALALFAAGGAPAAAWAAADDDDARITELERRIAELEGRIVDEPDDAERLPSVSGWGGVAVGAPDVVLDAVGLAGPVDVAGTVRGNAVGLGADVHVADGGRVVGNAVSLGGEVVTEPGADVSGQRLSISLRDGAESALALPLTGDLVHFGHTLARRLALLFLFAAAGTVTLAVWPRQVDDVAERIADRPFWYGIVGGILTLALSIGTVVLSMTVIGLPLALLFTLVLALAWLVGLAAVCRATGARLASSHALSDTGAYLVGAGLLAAASMVPVVGAVAVVFLALPAVGAAVVSGLSLERHHREW